MGSPTSADRRRRFDSIARMELSKVTSAFFLRFNAEIDPSMTEEDMDMFDQFSASPVGGRLLIRVQEREH